MRFSAKMTSISVADCMVDRGYLAEFCNVNYKQLPVQDENFQVSPENMEEKSCEVKSSEAKSIEAKSSEAKNEVEKTSILPLDSEKNKDSEDELRSRIFGLTKELHDMKQFMAEKMQKQVQNLSNYLS